MANNAPAECYKVVYKRATDLALGKDVPICCNIILCDMLDEGEAPQHSLQGCLICIHAITLTHLSCSSGPNIQRGAHALQQLLC